MATCIDCVAALGPREAELLTAAPTHHTPARFKRVQCTHLPLSLSGFVPTPPHWGEVTSHPPLPHSHTPPPLHPPPCRYSELLRHSGEAPVAVRRCETVDEVLKEADVSGGG
jgi:hypothetical protein